MPVDSPQVILFDGVCGLCNAWVDLVLSQDRRGTYRFVALQSDVGRGFLASHGLPADYDASIILVKANRALVRSAAIVEILAGLGGLWRIGTIGRLLPATLLDRAYDFIASRRYQWFGRRAVCRMPTAAERSRFIF